MTRAGATATLQTGKAETLASLAGGLRYSEVPKLIFFPVNEWAVGGDSRQHLANRIRSTLRPPFAVRSSACDEDSPDGSLAGRYLTRLEVPGAGDALEAAIDDVARSLGAGGHQILVQEMVAEAVLAGVVLTRDLNTGGPYYCVNYDESGRADSVTGGRGRSNTVLVHHAANPEPSWLASLLEMVRELEGLFRQQPLDVEFALRRDGVFCLLQVRGLAARATWKGVRASSVGEAIREAEAAFARINRPVPGLAGRRTLLGLMPDWNPAELIGAEPSPLALSLFGRLITDSVWWQARASMGYRKAGRPLLHPVAGRPYVDVRTSFNSLLPAGLPNRIETTLAEAWLDRLAARPELHDKVEFEIAQTALDLCFRESFDERYRGSLAPRDFALYENKLRSLTRRNVSLDPSASLGRALTMAAGLEKTANSANPPEGGPETQLRHCLRLLDRCRRRGTFPFAIVARHAFIAETLLRSAAEAGVVDETTPANLKQSIASVASRIRRDFHRARKGQLPAGEFLAEYGHLRPGLFDIRSPRYDRRPDLFAGRPTAEDPTPPRRGQVSSRVDIVRLDRALASVGLSLTGRDLLSYAREAIRQREEIKFRFSRLLSDALEGLARWGELIGLSREDVSMLTLKDLADRPRRDLPEWMEIVASRKGAAERRRGLRLGPLIRDARDLRVIEMSSGCANFVTSKNAVGSPLHLENGSPLSLDVTGKIACLDAADPGFDWLFSRGVAGLITKFGGSNSHMAIRCAELSVPAAIGVGESLFQELLDSPCVELRCRERVVRPLSV